MNSLFALCSHLVLSALAVQAAAPQAPSPHGQQPPAPPQVTAAQYRVYTSDGKPVALDELVAAVADAEVVFVGEEHDDPGAHYLEAELLRRADAKYGAKRPVALSLEMFERDVQGTLDEYLTGLITERHFLQASRPWNNYAADYRPMVEYARERKLPVIAANAPGRYANRASRLGRESLAELPESSKAWIAPLPYGEPLPAYAAKFEALMGGPPGSGTATAHAPLHLLDGQALWDATMAYSIAQELMRRPGALVLHVNGKFHSEERMGVPYQLLRYRPGTKEVVVTVVSGEGFPNFDVQKLGKLGDYVILTDPSLKSTNNTN